MRATLGFLALGYHRPIARESSQDQSNCPGSMVHAAAEPHWGSKGRAPWAAWAGHRANRALQDKWPQSWDVEPNWQETGGSGSATARQGGTIWQPGRMSSNQVECQQGSQGRGSYQMKRQERLQGSVVQLEELKWKWRKPKWVESLFFGETIYINFCLGSQLRQMLPKLYTLYQVFGWTMPSLVNGYRNANIMHTVTVFRDRRGKKIICPVSDGLSRCFRKLLFPYSAAQQPTTCLLCFQIDIIQSRKHSRVLWGWENWPYFPHSLNSFTTNFRFKFLFKGCLPNQICGLVSFYTSLAISIKYLSRILGIVN